MSIDKKVAIVTGAARGIGAATVRRFADEASSIPCPVRTRAGTSAAATSPTRTA
ncbi:MAG: hypothetical protein J0H54_04695 [Rhizobiales bacterium]|nr:hypothetical protein [Hyphomicrobiales bacterium]